MESSLEIRLITRLKGSSPKKSSSQGLVSEVTDPTTGQFFQPASKAALPPAAVVLTVMVCSAQKR